MTGTAGGTQGEAQVPETPKGKGLPAWAWGAIGVAVGAVVIGGAWLLYESGRSAGKNESFAVGTIETSGTQAAEESADASATADDTTTAQSADGSTASGTSSGGTSGSGSSGGTSGSSSGSSGSSSGSSGSDSSPDLPAPPTPITPSKPTLKQKAPVALWMTKLTESRHGSWNSAHLTYSTSQHLRLVISVVEGDGSGSMTVKFANPDINGWSHELFSTTHATTGANYTTPAQDVEANKDYEVRVSADPDVKWSVKVQTRP
jgi:hypothetical protein